MRMMRASVVSAPTASVRHRQHAFGVDGAAGDAVADGLGHRHALAGDQRFVDMAAAGDAPRRRRRRARPAARRPGRPRCTCSTGTSTSTPSRCTRAVAGRSAFSARIASAVCRLARPSSHLPSSTSVMTAAEASKYRCGMPWPACLTQQVDRQAVGGRGAQRHQQVHVAGAGAHRLPAGAVEAPAQPELHRRGQRQLHPAAEHPVDAEELQQHRHHQRQASAPRPAPPATSRAGAGARLAPRRPSRRRARHSRPSRRPPPAPTPARWTAPATVACSVARLTVAAVTPGTLSSAFSTRATHEAQVMPSTCSVAVGQRHLVAGLAHRRRQRVARHRRAGLDTWPARWPG